MPAQRAKNLFLQSFASLMAHSVRAVTNEFARNGVELDVRISPDLANAIHLQAPNRGATSILRTRFRRRTSPTERDRVTAFIFIHKNANKHLARICIAHEIYHLLLELDAFIAKDGTAWPQIESTKLIEDQCDQFAWQLCKYHDRFNHDESLRGEHIYFPAHMFDNPLKTRTTANHLEWPEGIALDLARPFYRVEPPPWVEP